MAMGFRHVESGPLVRSSYHAWEQVQAAGVAYDADRHSMFASPTSDIASDVRCLLRRPDGTDENQAKTRVADAPRIRRRSYDTTLLRSMLLQRRFEERCAEAYALGKIGGFCHLYIGQEAVGTGAISLLRPDDYIITTYRDHGQALARGMTPRAVMAELFGRVDGCARGKGGSMHMFDTQPELPRRTRHRRRARSARAPASASRSSIAAATRSASASWASRS